MGLSDEAGGESAGDVALAKGKVLQERALKSRFRA